MWKKQARWVEDGPVWTSAGVTAGTLPSPADLLRDDFLLGLVKSKEKTGALSPAWPILLTAL